MADASAGSGPKAAPVHRLALGLSYRGTAYQGWQSQPSGQTIQDHLERALTAFAAQPVKVFCAGRTDAGVHALNQVVHFDAPVQRDLSSWVRGANRYLPADIAVQWCHQVAPEFNARSLARGRRYAYIVLSSPVRPAVEAGSCGWVFKPLQVSAMQHAAQHLLGEHDFSSFRAAGCQAASPIKTVKSIEVRQCGRYVRFDFEASAFLHHMVRNIMGCLLAVGTGQRTVGWVEQVLQARSRDVAAPTFAAAGLYFLGPYYDAVHALPERTAAFDWLPGS